MKGNTQSHPARSVDFLSRLHDGELDAGERARFESHRAHCTECRRSVVEFEDAITLFRTARSNPPRSDLAGRILRKVQSTNRPRTPFPRRFQIDLGWAALMLTALFAVLIMTPILGRKHETASPPTSPESAPKPPVVVLLPPPEPAAPSPESGGETRPKQGLADSRRIPRARSPRDEAPRDGAVAAVPRAQAGSAKPLEGEEPSEVRRKASGAAAVLPPAPGAEGEGVGSGRAESAAVSLRVSVREADGFGAPPGLRSVPHITLPPAERGREFLVVVDPQGVVRKVIAQREVSTALSGIRFEAGPRPRRLLVRLD